MEKELSTGPARFGGTVSGKCVMIIRREGFDGLLIMTANGRG